MKTLFRIFSFLATTVFILCTVACDDLLIDKNNQQNNENQQSVNYEIVTDIPDFPADEEIAAFTFVDNKFPNGINWAGLRSSPYGFEQDNTGKSFPSVSNFDTYASKMAANYPGSKGAFVWIVGVVEETTWNCNLNLPLKNIKLDKVSGEKKDKNVDFLQMASQKGYDVWLQVESGDADICEMAWLILNRYKNYPCVKGFGVDVEWYKPEGTNGYGTKITDETAEKLNKIAKMVNPNYTVFLKHWDSRWMPESYRSDLIFVTDSQGLRSLDNYKKAMERWASNFSKNPVFLQIGYDRDEEKVWGALENPTKDLGTYISQDFINSNPIGIIWVDFTLRRALK